MRIYKIIFLDRSDLSEVSKNKSFDEIGPEDFNSIIHWTYDYVTSNLVIFKEASGLCRLLKDRENALEGFKSKLPAEFKIPEADIPWLNDKVK